MINYAFPMQGCFLSNELNTIRTSSTMCTKLAQVSQNPSLFMLAPTYLTLVMDLCQWVLRNVLCCVFTQVFFAHGLVLFCILCFELGFVLVASESYLMGLNLLYHLGYLCIMCCMWVDINGCKHQHINA
jgi:hypothetical protein